MSKHDILNDLCYSLKSPASYGSAKTLFKHAKVKIPSINLREVQEWLSKQLSYSLHKPIARKFTTRPVVVYSRDELWQMDLVDLSNISKWNKGYKFILVVIDVFSKFAWLIPLKSKEASNVKEGLVSLFSATKRRPAMIQTDKGKEFLNTLILSLLKEERIKLYYTFSERKASVVERLNRTMKSIMFKYFTKHDTKKYIDILPELVAKYNNSFHRSIKMKPSEVDVGNEPVVWMNLYDGRLFPRIESKNEKDLLIGDPVRISIERGPFRKGYLEGWSEEIFYIEYKMNGMPPVYKLKDQADESIKGIFYAKELQKVIEPDTYRIERIVRRKRDREGNLLYFVKWKGYPEKFNSYIRADDIAQP